MPDKPRRAADYHPHYVELIRSACLYLATRLGDFQDDLVVVGGLVPTLLVPVETLATDTDPHVGTVDLDLGLELAILGEDRYSSLAEQLRRSGFSPDENKLGRRTRQRWKIEQGEKITLDFLIPPVHEGKGDRIFPLTEDLAAIVAPGLQLAFRDRVKVSLSGLTLHQERATRSVWVCGPGAYVVLKALAFRNRGEYKDAYDLYFVVRNYGTGVEDVASHLKPLLDDPDARAAVGFLRDDFVDLDGLGPRRVAEFLRGAPDEKIQADVVSFIGALLDLIR